ncbi:FG-GAP repeat domain-containing protein [Microtetraspora niveoalba]|uniref:FG-GAP repeat domain-containing protein n=1 Tax=Microtetraspora niveoalba TaxID=46175 RepID=UPI00083742E6|nr:VCBS repeat-containing protein [Microtetraspora niveoalba]
MRASTLTRFAPCLLAGLLAAATASCAATDSGPRPPRSSSPAATPATGVPSATAARDAREAAKARDFNGDGYADLAVGVREGAVNGVPGAGRVQVVYGSSSGVASTRRQVLDRGGAAVKGEGFGATLASGDLDGDGYADLAVGAPGRGGRAGSVTIAFGAGPGLSDRLVALDRPGDTTGFGAALAVGDYDGDGRDDLAVSTFDAVWVAYGSGGIRRGRAGWTPVMGNTARVGPLASGDVDGDGYADLAVVYSEDDPADEGMGAVYRGSREGLADRLPGTFPGWGVGDVAIGDLDGDGFGDVVAGNSYADAEDPGGQIYVSRGSARGLEAERVIWTLSSPGMPRAPEGTDGLGGAVAVGDVDGDGYADVAVGASGGAGAALVLYGGGSGVSARGARLYDPGSAGVAADVVQGFGQEVALADLDGDGRAELAVSTRAEQRVTVLSPGGPETGGGAAKGAVQLTPARQGEGFGHPLN